MAEWDFEDLPEMRAFASPEAQPTPPPTAQSVQSTQTINPAVFGTPQSTQSMQPSPEPEGQKRSNSTAPTNTSNPPDKKKRIANEYKDRRQRSAEEYKLIANLEELCQPKVEAKKFKYCQSKEYYANNDDIYEAVDSTWGIGNNLYVDQAEVKIAARRIKTKFFDDTTEQWLINRDLFDEIRELRRRMTYQFKVPRHKWVDQPARLQNVDDEDEMVDNPIGPLVKDEPVVDDEMQLAPESRALNEQEQGWLQMWEQRYRYDERVPRALRSRKYNAAFDRIPDYIRLFALADVGQLENVDAVNTQNVQLKAKLEEWSTGHVYCNTTQAKLAVVEHGLKTMKVDEKRNDSSTQTDISTPRLNQELGREIRRQNQLKQLREEQAAADKATEEQSIRDKKRSADLAAKLARIQAEHNQAQAEEDRRQDMARKAKLAREEKIRQLEQGGLQE